MSAVILGAVSHARDGCADLAVHPKDSDYACNGLGMWMLQRLPHQQGRWCVQLHIRGLCVDGLAVQDDFGNLQMVAV